jgi:hypothetical protein
MLMTNMSITSVLIYSVLSTIFYTGFINFVSNQIYIQYVCLLLVWFLPSVSLLFTNLIQNLLQHPFRPEQFIRVNHTFCFLQSVIFSITLFNISLVQLCKSYVSTDVYEILHIGVLWVGLSRMFWIWTNSKRLQYDKCSSRLIVETVFISVTPTLIFTNKFFLTNYMNVGNVWSCLLVSFLLLLLMNVVRWVKRVPKWLVYYQLFLIHSALYIYVHTWIHNL